MGTMSLRSKRSASLFEADRRGQAMSKFVKLAMFYVALAFALVSAAQLKAQQKKETPIAPVPPQILTSRKVFISNAGYDSTSRVAFKNEGDLNQPYNQFYSAVKDWGRYELVANPADADLVFEIRFTAPLTFYEKTSVYEPQLDLEILDVKTHFKLWSIMVPVEGAFRKVTWEKNFSQGIANLLDDLKKLTTQPAG
jgi:opacity protein-like surface antigen